MFCAHRGLEPHRRLDLGEQAQTNKDCNKLYATCVIGGWLQGSLGSHPGGSIGRIRGQVHNIHAIPRPGAIPGFRGSGKEYEEKKAAIPVPADSGRTHFSTRRRAIRIAMPATWVVTSK